MSLMNGVCAKFYNVYGRSVSYNLSQLFLKTILGDYNTCCYLARLEIILLLSCNLAGVLQSMHLELSSYYLDYCNVQ